MRPAVRAQIELTPEMLAVLDDAATRKRRSDALVERSRIDRLVEMADSADTPSNGQWRGVCHMTRAEYLADLKVQRGETP